ncbi:hypothetical protein [Streptomyces mirabilis]|uniref:hypothetical protein n=1 Tax=Streptomyces mirabilis TaxID=68239 RepID=UPI0033B55CEF
MPQLPQCEIVNDSDVLVLRIGETTVSASWELASTWYIDVEDSASPESADSIASEIAHRLGEAAGKQALWNRVTD